MEIRLFSGNSSASSAQGLVVVVDVLRAATVEAYALKQGAKYIIPVVTEEDAFSLKKEHPEYLLMGEKYGLKVEGFDFGNSPDEILKQDVAGKVLIHKTTNGTIGLHSATKASDIVFGSFVTFSAIVRFVQQKNPSVVSLISAEFEDELFATFLKETLENKHPSFEVIKKKIIQHPSISHFLDPKRPEFVKEDLELSLQLDTCDFVCLAKRHGENLIVQKYMEDY